MQAVPTIGLAVAAGILVLVAIILVVYRYQTRLRKRREAMLAQVALKLSGRVQAGSFFRMPSITFEHHHFPASVEFYSTGGKHPTYYTRLFLHLPSAPDYQVRIYPERWFSRVGKWLGGQDIQVGVADFDDKFMVKGSCPQKVGEFLSAEIQNAIYQLRALKMNDHIEIQTHKNSLLIQKLTWLEAQDLLETFTDLGLQVMDGYLRGAERASSGASPAGPSAQPESCGVCGDTISGSSRACPRCGRPHHPECWDLNDGCGVCPSP